MLADRIATATRIIESQRALLKRLRAGKQATVEVEGALSQTPQSIPTRPQLSNVNSYHRCEANVAGADVAGSSGVFATASTVASGSAG